MTTAELKKLDPLDRLLYWVKEREKIRVAKESGAKPPWTHDPILRTYRFCNVRRADDKVSRWLLDNWYVPYRDHPNMLAAVALARNFNLPETLRNIQADIFHGPPGQRTGTKFSYSKAPDWDDVKRRVRVIKADGHAVFNGAYIVSTNGRKMDKIDAVMEYCRAVVGVEIDSSSMEETHGRLSKCYGTASFMAGQMVADLRHAVTGAWADRNDWAPIGPGSRRGMNRLHGRDKKYSLGQDDFLRELRELIPYVREALPGGKGDQLEAMDVQSVLCESDKYDRVLFGEGRPKQLYRGG